MAVQVAEDLVITEHERIRLQRRVKVKVIAQVYDPLTGEVIAESEDEEFIKILFKHLTKGAFDV